MDFFSPQNPTAFFTRVVICKLEIEAPVTISQTFFRAVKRTEHPLYTVVHFIFPGNLNFFPFICKLCNCSIPYALHSGKSVRFLEGGRRKEDRRTLTLSLSFFFFF